MDRERVVRTRPQAPRRDRWTRALRRLSAGVAAPGRCLWALTATLAAADALWAWGAGIAIEPGGVAVVAALVAGLLAVAALLGPVKSDPPLRGMALASAFLLAFTAAAALLHTLAAGLDRPLIDPFLARVEAALGFDWPAAVALLAGHPDLSRGLALAYHSSGPQVGLVVIALSATRRLGRLWAFLRLFAVALLSVIAVSALWPALGPYAWYAPQVRPGAAWETAGALWHLEPVARMRAGAVHGLALADLRGLATFPSFHICLAVLTAWALAPVPLIGPCALVLNAAVAMGTIAAGGHYLPDVIAGGALAAALLAGRTSRRLPRRSPFPRAPVSSGGTRVPPRRAAGAGTAFGGPATGALPDEASAGSP